jgi:hypothetical protein
MKYAKADRDAILRTVASSALLVGRRKRRMSSGGALRGRLASAAFGVLLASPAGASSGCVASGDSVSAPRQESTCGGLGGA